MIGLVIVTIILISIGIVLVKYSNEVSKEPPKKSKATGKELEGIMSLVGGAIFLFIVFKLVTMAYEGTTGFFSDKADRKDRCRTSYSVKNAKTEFAAKQAYKACMRD